MLDLTDRHCRAFFRLFSGNIRLYTEMVVVGSIIHGDRDRFLGFDSSEHPVALQLGGCDPGKLGFCSRLAEERGYNEVNLNIGCPSDRVKSAQFGACLMARPWLVADCVGEMISCVSIPVTVKTRIGIDDQDSYEHLAKFIETVSQAGCKQFIVHARKAWLTGLSPKENRTVPPLHYNRVYKLKVDFPDIAFTLNGGITSIGQVENHLPKVDGVMIGREAYQNPWILKQMDEHFFKNEDPALPGVRTFNTRREIVDAYLPYVERQLSHGVYLRHMTRHILGLFHGQGGAKGWRRHLSEYGPRRNAGIEVIQEALKFVDTDKEQEGIEELVAYG